MAKVDEKAEKLFSELLKNNCISDNTAVIEKITELSRQLDYSAPLRAVLSHQQKKVKRLSKEIEKLPLGFEGKPMTLQEIHDLNLGYSMNEIKRIVENDAKHIFPTVSSTESSVFRNNYFIDYKNIYFLDKNKLTTFAWSERMIALEHAHKQVAYTNSILRDLESRCDVVESPIVPIIVTNRTLNYLEKPTEMTISEIIGAGSPITCANIHYKVRSNNFSLRKEGNLLRIIVTKDNYSILGLPGKTSISQEPQAAAVQNNEEGLLQEGQYLVTELKAYTGYHPVHMTKIVQKNIGLFMPKRAKGKGRPIEVTITRQNQALLKLTKIPLEKSVKKQTDSTQTTVVGEGQNEKNITDLSSLATYIRNPSKITLKIDGNDLPFSYDSDYLTTKTEDILKRIHPGVFSSSESVKNAFEFMDAREGKIKGAKLIAFLEATTGMMVLSSHNTQTQLEKLLGEDFPVINQQLERHSIRQFVYKLPDIVQGQFIVRSELPIIKKMYDSLEVDGDSLPIALDTNALDVSKRQRIEQYNEEFRTKNILPPSISIYNKLIMANVLNIASIPGIHISHRVYERKMRGWQAYDFNRARMRAEEMPWTKFREEAIKPLLEENLVKDLINDYNGRINTNDLNYFVVKAGKKEEVKNLLAASLKINL